MPIEETLAESTVLTGVGSNSFTMRCLCGVRTRFHPKCHSVRPCDKPQFPRRLLSLTPPRNYSNIEAQRDGTEIVSKISQAGSLTMTVRLVIRWKPESPPPVMASMASEPPVSAPPVDEAAAREDHRSHKRLPVKYRFSVY